MRIAILLSVAIGVCCATTAIAQPTARAYRDAVHREHLGQFWGAVLVIDGGEVVCSEGFGFQNAEDLRPIDERSLFDIGSISKPITAIAILQLVERGELSLDATMEELFGEASTSPATVDITVRQLLTHSSGLDDRAAIQRLDFPDRDGAVRLALTSRPASAPGERWAYCNAGYIVLAAVIEKASGMDFEAFVRKNIFEPAGMDGTGFITGDGLDPDHFTAREVAGRGGFVQRGMLEDGWGWGLRGAGGVLTSVHDLARFHEALTRPDVVLSAESLALMDTVAWSEGRPMALGWFAAAAPDGTRRLGHGGSTRGYMAELRRYPDRDAMIAVLTNTRWRPDALADTLEMELLGIKPSRARALIDLDGLEVTEYKSVLLDAPDLSVRALEGGGVLVVARHGESEPLRLELNASAARAAHASLASIIEAQAGNAMDRTTLGLYTNPYEPDGTRRTIEGEAVSLRVQPNYNRQSGPTLVLQDEANGFWPVIMRLSDADAGRLAEQLGRVVGDAKRGP